MKSFIHNDLFILILPKDLSKSDSLQYIAHTVAADQLSKCLDELGHSKDVSILDFGCGTGFAGQELSKRGYKIIDGLDCCKEMLEIAKVKGTYRELSQGVMGSEDSKDLGVVPNQYDAAICIGVFTMGHVKAKGFDDLLYVLKPGGLVCFSVRDSIANDPHYGYQEKLMELSNENKWKLVAKSYEKYHNADPMAWYYVYQKL